MQDVDESSSITRSVSLAVHIIIFSQSNNADSYRYAEFFRRVYPIGTQNNFHPHSTTGKPSFISQQLNGNGIVSILVDVPKKVIWEIFNANWVRIVTTRDFKNWLIIVSSSTDMLANDDWCGDLTRFRVIVQKWMNNSQFLRQTWIFENLGTYWNYR